MNYLSINDIEEKELIPGYYVKLIHTEFTTIAYWRIEESKSMPVHTHPNEQTVNMIEGEFELVVENDKKVIKKGDIVIIPPNIPHSGKALTNCRIIDVFYPVRTDYK